MKNDARVRYTQQTLKSALLGLMDNKPVNRITVKEVCEKAGLNRATFYTHYTDCYDLLAQIENDLIADFVASLQYLRSWDMTDMINAIFEMIERNIELCRVVVFKNKNAALLTRMIEIAHDRSIAYWREQLKKATDQELEMLFCCLANGLMNVVVEGYGKYDRATLVNFVNVTVRSSVAAYQ